MAVKMVSDGILTQAKVQTDTLPRYVQNNLNILTNLNHSKQIKNIKTGFRFTIKDIFGELDNEKIKSQLTDFIAKHPKLNSIDKSKLFNNLGLDIDFNEHVFDANASMKELAIIEVMQKFGYKPHEKGICAGLAFMGCQAVLRRDGQSFLNRMNLLKNYNLDKLISHQPEPNENQEKAKLTKMRVDILAFFDEVSIYDGIRSVNDDFKNLIPEFHLGIDNVKKIELINEQKILKFPYKKYSYPYIVTNYDLKDLLLNMIELNPEKTFSILINYRNHAIQLGFDGKNWLLVDHDEVIYCDKSCINEIVKAACDAAKYSDKKKWTHTSFINISSDESTDLIIPNIKPEFNKLKEDYLYQFLYLCALHSYDDVSSLDEIIKVIQGKYKVNDFDLLTCKMPFHLSPFDLAIVSHNLKVAQFFTEKILASNLTNAEIKSFLNCINNPLQSGLSLAIEKNNIRIISAIVNCILNSTLNPDEKAELLKYISPDGEQIPALHKAMVENNADQTKIFIDAILNLNLDKEAIIELLLSKDETDKSALYAAMMQDSADAIKPFIVTVLSTNLPIEDKVSLLAARDSNDISALNAAIEEDSNNAICVYIESILELYLTP